VEEFPSSRRDTVSELNFEKGSVQYGVHYPALKPVAAAIKREGKFINTALYEYEPGNATRYVVLFATYNTGYGPETVMTVVNMNASMIIPGRFFSPSQIGYMKEKLGILEGDCYALMPLVNAYLEETGQ
jgi:hypothetical protein